MSLGDVLSKPSVKASENHSLDSFVAYLLTFSIILSALIFVNFYYNFCNKKAPDVRGCLYTTVIEFTFH